MNPPLATLERAVPRELFGRLWSSRSRLEVPVRGPWNAGSTDSGGDGGRDGAPEPPAFRGGAGIEDGDTKEGGQVTAGDKDGRMGRGLNCRADCFLGFLQGEQERNGRWPC